MPRQGPNKKVKQLASPDEVADDSQFRLQCTAVLLTWNIPEGAMSEYPGRPSAMEAYIMLLNSLHWPLVKHYTICAELEAHWHIHAYLVFHKKVDHSTAGWMLYGAMPNVSPNTTTGSGFSTAVNRGSFYVANEYKKSFQSHTMNYFPAGADGGGATYSVKTQWVIDQWSQSKLRDAVECAGKYKCLTPPFKALVTMSQGQITSLDRRNFHAERAAVLQSDVCPFKTYPECDEFLKQFEKQQFRYKFLWISGETRLGKTQLAKSFDSNFYHHKNSINWADYNPSKHSTIIFDDCSAIDEYILHHKMLFQASEVTTVNTSRTNCFALEVDTVCKKIIVCSNTISMHEWIEANCIYLDIVEPTWVEN